MSKRTETKNETGEEQSQEHITIFSDNNEIVHKEFVLAGQRL
jgi:hypothetical protein